MTSADQDSLLLTIETRANTGGLDAYERKVVAAAEATNDANAQAASAINAQTQAVKANTVTVEQSRAAWARAGGDFEKFKTELAAVAGTASETGAAVKRGADEGTAATEREIQAMGRLHARALELDAARTRTMEAVRQRAAQEAAAVEEASQREGMAMARTQEQALRMNAAFDGQSKSIERIPRNARTGASGLTQMAFAMSGAGTSAQNLANAAGNVAISMSTMSSNARIAASAAGIGAIAIGVAALIPLLIRAKEALDTSITPTGAVNDFTRQHIQNLKDVTETQREIALARAQVDQLTSKVGGRGDEAGVQAVANAQTKVNALIVRENELRTEGRIQTEQQRAQLAATNDAEEKRIADLTRQQTAQAASIQHQLIGNIGELDARNLDAFARRRLAAQATYEDEVARIRELTMLSVDGQNELIALAARRHALTLQQIAEELQARRDAQQAESIDSGLKTIGAQIEARNRQRDADAEAAAAAKKADEERLKVGLAGYQRLASSAQGYGKIVTQVAKTAADAVRRYEIFTQAKKDWILAKTEWAAAMASFAAQNYAGGALHLAAAGGYTASAAAGFAEAGGGGGGGGGGGSGGGGGGSLNDSTFTPNDRSGAGSFTLNIITRDPYGKDAIATTRFYLRQAQDLNHTIPVAPTNGVQISGATG